MSDKEKRESALRPESSCPVLKLGRLSYSDLAKWLGISPNSIWKKKTKERSLNKLKLYANYHLEKNESGKREYIVIDEIFIDVYSKTMDIVIKETDANLEPIDTGAHVGRKIHNKNSVLNKSIKEDTCIVYVNTYLRQAYGKLYDEYGAGEKGTRAPIWCKINGTPVGNYYIPLNEEELKLIDEARQEAKIDLNSPKNVMMIETYNSDRKSMTQEEKARAFDDMYASIGRDKYVKFITTATQKLGYRPYVASAFTEVTWFENNDDAACADDESEQQN